MDIRKKIIQSIAMALALGLAVNSANAFEDVYIGPKFDVDKSKPKSDAKMKQEGWESGYKIQEESDKDRNIASEEEGEDRAPSSDSKVEAPKEDLKTIVPGPGVKPWHLDDKH